ncbi:hypothetical protein AW736_00915 [Termitidicoccus mucosus]|uniref:Right handed beta helix domain-containing protein n=1 Tax=Termitidicoccus mucosus TaxID=1184151 RepID=A0A178IKS5_9BACT|nr:hypothetical protein AW736_00915 [Opitutaceae bacterium TSB47]
MGIALCASLLALNASGINVRDFGAVADDSICDLAAIRRAVAFARANNVREINFDPGTYDLEVKNPEKEIAIDLNGFEDLVFAGAVNADGTPATLLLRKYEFSGNISARQILRAIKCKHIHLKNFVLDNAPRYTTAGKVVEKDGDRVIMEIFDGNPAIDGCVFYCGNAWDLKTGSLKKIGSLTFGADVAANEGAYTLRLLPQTASTAPRRMVLANAKVAAMLDVGDGVSWHFGWEGNQLNVTMSEDVRLENIHTYNAMGFCASVSRSKDVFASNLVFKPAGNQLAVGSRDGLMLSCNRGRVVMDGLHIEGVRWDGQNAHGIFLWTREIMDSRTVVLESRRGSQNVEIQPGSSVGFYTAPDEERVLTVRQAVLKKDGAGKYHYQISFEEELPPGLDSSMPVCVYAWNMDDYVVKNSRFRNIAGCASLVRNRGVKIENCIYENIMYPAVMIGPAIQEQEGPVARNIMVKNNRFINCGWQTRHGAVGAVSAKVQVWKNALAPFMRDLQIEGNYFENCDVAVQVEDAINARVAGNSFNNVKDKILGKNLRDSMLLE